MHSSRMRTGHTLAVCCSLLWGGGGFSLVGGCLPVPWGFSLVWGGVSAWSQGMFAWSGGLLLGPGGFSLVPGYVFTRVCDSVHRGGLPGPRGGSPWSGGWCLPGPWGGGVLWRPPLWTESQTRVKT